ncbi:hypothetical protein LJ655_28745 [Paraburkholderia sp. MMS20-SJTN17]|uniref:Response regulatory domain-containing protein n=1 Tax=Paraburkholderia translucens TaxID=2886945 RepID=A0ABS8KLX8_9BURK|nr:hypothetical protein [Paraburkholderia sp. MMS20-SJTN17]MCC8405798.1 hypothetical protein [Paraburkholderia sp. MMS20-SJTN17]
MRILQVDLRRMSRLKHAAHDVPAIPGDCIRSFFIIATIELRWAQFVGGNVNQNASLKDLSVADIAVKSAQGRAAASVWPEDRWHGGCADRNTALGRPMSIVLLVDDDADNLRALPEVIETAGHEVVPRGGRG